MEKQGKLSRIKPYLGSKAFYKQTFIIALPIAMQSLITIGVNLIDNIMLGSLGDKAGAASSFAVQFIGLFNICCMGLGMGASVLVSRFWGNKDLDSLRKSVTLMLRFTLLFGTIFALLSAIIPKQIIGLYTYNEQNIIDGAKYLRWSVPCFILMGLTTTCTIVLRSTGQTIVPLIGSVFSFFINIFANWVFIFGNCGAPRMEIEGAAIGTLIARAFEFCFNCGYFFFIEKKIGYRIKNLFMKCADLMHDYITISIPVLISDAILGFGTSAVAIILGHVQNSADPDFSQKLMAANAITMAVQQLSTVLIQGISQAGCIVTGHNLGAGDRERAQREGWTFLLLGLLIGCVGGGFIVGAGDLIIGFYKEYTQEARDIASTLMKAVGVIVIFQSANSIITKGVLRGGGDTKCLMVADNIFLWLASIPLGAFVGLVLDATPVFWIYFCLKIDQFLKAIWCVYRLKSGKWIKRLKKEDATS